MCTSCQRTKPLEKFYTAGRHKGGSVRFHSHCKSCKLESEAAQRMHPRKGSQEVEMSGQSVMRVCLPVAVTSAFDVCRTCQLKINTLQRCKWSRACCRSATAPAPRAVGRSAKYIVSGPPPATATNGLDARSAEPPTASSPHGLQTESCVVQQPCFAKSACLVDVDSDATAAGSIVAHAPATSHAAACHRPAALQCCSSVCMHTPAVLSRSSRPCSSCWALVRGVQQFRWQQRQWVHTNSVRQQSKSRPFSTYRRSLWRPPLCR